MGDDSAKEEERLESEIEAARQGLKLDVEAEERKAKADLDEILSRDRMEFCERCGRKIGSRIDWAGRCLWEGCEKLLCRECWNVKKLRFCKQHSRSVYGVPEEGAKKREFFGDEDIKLDLQAMLQDDDESRKSKLLYYASEYYRWLQKRFEKAGPIDWTPQGYLRKPMMKPEKRGDEYVIYVSVKRWFWKKVKLSVVVCSFDPVGEQDYNSLTALLHRLSRKHKGYNIMVLVTDKAKLDTVNFVNQFNDSSFTLFMVEPRKGNLYFNINDNLARGYSPWFSQKKEPYPFKAKVKRLADLVSGRLVIDEKAVFKEFGFNERDVHGILQKCDFLHPIKGTGTFFWKED
ncbi:MAG: hypothetical protein JXC85_00895 [Candidatus Aenigmarchaeota archaeon]|nr:hypothetical protein [Candidatus Aenigmarchaeota archaeon]